jgi:hypothetical protein
MTEAAIHAFLDWGLSICWLSGTATGGFCLAVLWHRKLARTYPMLSAYLGVGFLRSVHLISLWARHDGPGYSDFWRITQPIIIGLYAVMVLEAIFAQAKHFPKIGWVATIFCAGFGLISAVTCLLVAGITFPPSLPNELAWMAKYYGLLCASVLLFSRLLFTTPLPKMRRNVKRHVLILTWLFTGAAVAGFLVSWGGPRWTLATIAGQMLTVVNPLGCYLAWIFCLRTKGEQWNPLAYRHHSHAELELDWSLLYEIQATRKALREK